MRRRGEMSVTIVSKEGEQFLVDKQILNFAGGLEAYDPEDIIKFDELISGKFLRVMKDFYEKNEFNAEKMAIKKKISSSNLKENLIGEVNYQIMKQIYDRANETKNLDELIELITCAEFLRTQELIDLIHCTFATLLFCPDNEAELADFAIKWDLDAKQPNEMIEEI